MTERPRGLATLLRHGPASASRTVEKALIGLLATAIAGLAWVNDLNSNPGWLYSLLALGFGSLLVLGWIYHLTEPVAEPRRAGALRMGLFLGVACGLRLLVLPIGPSLSNDVQRYLWDGHVAVSGENPYALAPADPALDPLREPPSMAQWQQIWLAMSHRSVETVYPPVALSVFSIAALGSDRLRLPALWLYKGVLVAIEVLGCWLLFVVAKRFRLPAWRSILYAWNPLVLVEVAGMGHIDGAGLLPVALTLLFLEAASRRAPAARSQIAAAVAAVAAVAVKLVPLVVLPFWAVFGLRRTRRWVFLFAVALVFGITFAPLMVSVGGLPPGLVTYGVSWEFNGPLYEPLYRLLQVGASDSRDSWFAALVKLAVGLAGRVVGGETVESAYGFVYPQFLAKAVLAGLLALCLGLQLRRPRGLVEGTQMAFGAALLSIATVYPWYLLWVLPWAGLTLSLPWLVASASLMLAYLPRVWGVEYFPTVYLLVWLPPALTLLAVRLSVGAFRTRNTDGGKAVD